MGDPEYHDAVGPDLPEDGTEEELLAAIRGKCRACAAMVESKPEDCEVSVCPLFGHRAEGIGDLEEDGG